MGPIMTNSRSAKDADARGTMGMCQTRPPVTLHRRAPADMALSPDGAVFRSSNYRSIPTIVEDDLSNCGLLRS